jgi:hypothetical protein
LKAHHEGRKKDYTELKKQAAAGKKATKGWKHATIKAKEYRAEKDILEKMVIELGGTLPDRKTEVLKSLKRSRDEGEKTSVPGKPSKNPLKPAWVLT